LWDRIRTDLAAAAPARKTVPIWQWTMAAAAVLILAVSLSLAHPWRNRPSTNADFLTDDALREVQQAESAYTRSIARLSAIAGKSLDQSSSPLAGAYREKLLLLDSAIADLRANVETNRYNVYLQNQLASLYREKQKTLQEWLENAKHN
jgi:hypothetical protein